MSHLQRITTFLGLSVAILALVALFALVERQSALAQTDDEEVVAQSPAETMPRAVQVSGRGEVRAQPDSAIVRVGVETEADEAVTALEENSVLMSEVISITVDAEIAEEDIQTQGLQLQPVYSEPGPEGGTREVTGYRARNVLQVTVRDLDALGELLDAMVEAGGNTIEGIQFEVSDAEEMRAQAREAAMNDARDKAEQLVTLADAELGEVLSITEVGAVPPPQPLALEEAIQFDQAVPIAPGTEPVIVDVQVTWRIE